jgi:ketosteroid isomerase-like protein
VRNPETHDTRALVERLFAAYVRGDSQQPFAHVAEEINLTFTGATPYRVNIAVSPSSLLPPNRGKH